MAKIVRPKAPPPRALGRKAFAAISAVEGLKLTREGKRRVEQSLSLDQRRAEVIRAYMEPNSKR